MSKIFKLFTFLILFAGLTMLNAQVFITEIADPNNNAGGRYIELYNAGATAVNFTEGSNWRIDKYTNASATVSQTLNLTGTIPAGGFYIIATGIVDGDFLALYGVDADQFDGADNHVAGSNGDDNLELYDGTGTLIDQFGVPGEDGTGTTHEFEDGRAERVATVTSGNALWNIAEWNIDSDAPTGDGPQDAPSAFDPRVWIGAGSSPVNPEPTNHISSFTAIANGYDEVDLTWTENDGAQIPAGYLIKSSTVSYASIEAPVDAIAEATDTDMSDNSGAVNVAHGSSSYSWTGLDGSTTFYYKVYPYSNSGTDIDYKTDGTVPESNATTDAAPVLPNLIINEFLADPDATNGDANGDGVVNTTQDEFVEIVNKEGSSVDISGYTIADGNGIRHTFQASTIIPDGGSVVVFGGGTPTGIKGTVVVANDATATLSLNNGGDIITFKDTLGNIIDTYTYGAEGGENESLARNPDYTGDFVKHSTILTNAVLFSPGRVNLDNLPFIDEPTPTSKDLNLTFEDNSEVTKWSHWDEANLYTTEAFDATGGVDGSGALMLGDAGYGMIDKRKVYATPGKNFSLRVAIKTQGWAVPGTYPLSISVEGIATVTPVLINSDSGFTTFNISGLVTSDSGYIRIAGSNTAGQNYIWIDNLVFDDDITVVQAPNLIFSEYIEGSSNNKAIEIYNANGGDVDLSEFRVIRANNGAVALSDSLVLSGTLGAGDVFVIGNSSAVSQILDVSDITSTLTYFNGDDFMGLQFNKAGIWETIDVVGLLGEDPGAGWKVAGVTDATANHTLVRKESVTIGNKDWAVSGDTTTGSSEWIVYDNDVFEYLGQHPGGSVDPNNEPLIAAPTPTVDSANVISLFSNVYNNAIVDTWSASWDVADVADTQVVGNDTKLYTNLVYAGIETTSLVIDATAMTHFHMDIWTPDPTVDPAVFKIKLVDFGADGAWSGGDDVEYEITLSAATTPALATGEWISIDLPLSDFTGLTTTEHMAQYIISGDLKTVYVDNIYFYKALNPIHFSNYESGLGDWAGYSVASTNAWVQKTGTGANGTSGFAEMNGYQEDVISNDYLIAGPFNLNDYTGEYLEFWSAAKYGGFEKELTLEYSTNYDGTSDPSTFTWTELTFTRPIDNNDTWTNSGKVNLADITSDAVYFAFHYLSDGTKGRWKIDEVGIYGTPEEGVDLPPVVESVNRTVLIPDANQNTEVTAIVTDDKGVSAVSLIYSNDGLVFNSVAMSNTTGNTWVGYVPESLYNDGDLFGYFVGAMDNSGKTDTSDIIMLFAGNTPIDNIKIQNEDGALEFTGLMARVTGTVSAGSGIYSTGRIEAYMQDSTAGILVIAFGTETPVMVEGNNYTVTGKIIQYNGLIEIEPVTPATDIVDNGAVTALVPKVLSIFEINVDPENYESQLVSIKGAELSSSTAWLVGSSSGSTMKIYTNTDTLDLRVDADTDIWGTDSPEFPQDITGVLGQYDSSAPFYSGYQLMPRRLSDFETAVSVDDKNGIPSVYALNQNYPNPFNPSTKIQFSIPENGMVTLKIFDILGREVMTLINEELPASYQTIEFNASSLTSGVYFYRMQVNNFTSVKKMILMK
ncbi:MAG: lamin tail domain-containing protein [Bacteroidetes bacterium]|nr:lamin tail domain-containing protein [Bacteroidota bacterium]MBU1800384.1 lamin tail domain-containing protein [Bacteroidota bacterium]